MRLWLLWIGCELALFAASNGPSLFLLLTLASMAVALRRLPRPVSYLVAYLPAQFVVNLPTTILALGVQTFLPMTIWYGHDGETVDPYFYPGYATTEEGVLVLLACRLASLGPLALLVWAYSKPSVAEDILLVKDLGEVGGGGVTGVPGVVRALLD